MTMNKCQVHKKYTGKRFPKTQCMDCLNYYISLGKLTRKPLPPPNKVHKDKTKYTRKKKHKKSD